MAERPSKRARRQISEDSTESSQEDSSSSDGTSGKGRQKAHRSNGSREKVAPSSSNTVSRPRRGAAAPTHSPFDMVAVSRSPSSSPEEHRKSIKLTVKMPSSRLREVTSQSSVGQSVAVNSRDTFEAGEIMTGKRRTRAQDVSKRGRTKEDAHDAWDDSEESQNGEEVEASSANDRPSTSEEESEEESEDMYDTAPLPPEQRHAAPASKSKGPVRAKSKSRSARTPALVVTPARTGPLKSVQGKEMEMEGEEDEELSELDSNGEGEDQNKMSIDAEGDEDDLAGEEDAEGMDDEEMEEEPDSDEETENSRSGTPKVQTKRQRGQEEGALLALPMEPQIKKILTADEHRMRRQEMARRRKNLSEKRNEEEKMSTINRLLKRQAPKRKGKVMNPANLEAAALAEGTSPAEDEDMDVEKAHPLFLRWINDVKGSRLGVPEEWLDKKVGRLFNVSPLKGSKLVDEIS